MGYSDLMKQRLMLTVRAALFSIKTMLQARKLLPYPKNVFFIIILILPLFSAVFVSNPISALAWLIALFICVPIIDAYAYAVVYGKS